jgi:tartrate dehydrogenase/decarboxylase / D-malate dehydrogenase
VLAAVATRLVLAPQEFDVIVASKLFGDILSDFGGALVGSPGIAASANLDPSGRDPSMSEPVHGSTPDIVGQGIANPIGAVGSAALMLAALALGRETTLVMQTTERALEDGARAPDVGGDCTTTEVTEAIAGQLPAPATSLVQQ